MPGTPLQSYGKTSYILIQGEDCYCASQAERRWLEHINPMLLAGEITKLIWQPEGSKLAYKYGGHDCADVYRPDARVTWRDGPAWTIEVKNQALHQKSASKMKRFAQQFPDEKLVLVWFGRIPTKGVAHRRLVHLEPWLDHIWRMK